MRAIPKIYEQKELKGQFLSFHDFQQPKNYKDAIEEHVCGD